MVHTFSGSPFSYPKIKVSSMISLFSAIPSSTIPVHPKNWFSDFDVYDATKNSSRYLYMNVPVVPKPTVESTLIVDEPSGAFSVIFVLVPILKEPKCADLSNDSL